MIDIAATERSRFFFVSQDPKSNIILTMASFPSLLPHGPRHIARGLITAMAVVCLSSLAHGEETERWIHGLHGGVAGGTAYLPVTGGTVLLEVHIPVFYRWPKSEIRFSPLYFHAKNDKLTADGLVLGATFRHHFSDLYAVSVGQLAGVMEAIDDGGSSGNSAMVGLSASPLTLKVGADERFELGVETVLLRQVNPGETYPGVFLQGAMILL